MNEAIALLIQATRLAVWAHVADDGDKQRMIEKAKAKLYKAEEALGATA